MVLPAEYGIDPTGVGRILGLTAMGEVKMRLAAEAAADGATTVVPTTVAIGAVAPAATAVAVPGPPIAAVAAAPASPSSKQVSRLSTDGTKWRDEVRFTLAPGQGTEVKLRMNEGDKIVFAWGVKSGSVNFDTHGDGGGRNISYAKGRGVAADEGELVAAFTGNHGWYWRNRGSSVVDLVLRTRGVYSDIQRMK